LISRISDRANRFLVEELRRREIPGIAPSHGDILGALLTHGELRMRELAALIGRDKSTVTTLVAKLIQLGYVKKTGHVADHRVSLISLSERGKALGKDIRIISNRLLDRAYREFSDRDKRKLVQLLTQMHDNF
jgi:DNA-binding MarR family transcriptional regulator